MKPKDRFAAEPTKSRPVPEELIAAAGDDQLTTDRYIAELQGIANNLYRLHEDIEKPTLELCPAPKNGVFDRHAFEVREAARKALREAIDKLDHFIAHVGRR